MPFSEHLPSALVLIFALGAFLLVKLVGYAAAATALRRAFPDSGGSEVGAWKAGAARVGLGVAGGLMYIALWNLLYHPHEEPSNWVHVVWQVGLFGTRVAEWWILFVLHFPGALRESKRGWFCALAGALWSHALDLPAMIAFGLTIGLLIVW